MTVRQGTQGPATTVRATVVAGLRTAAARVHDGAAHVRWYVRQVMGDDAYATYAAHQRAVHPGGRRHDRARVLAHAARRAGRQPGVALLLTA